MIFSRHPFCALKIPSLLMAMGLGLIASAIVVVPGAASAQVFGHPRVGLEFEYEAVHPNQSGLSSENQVELLSVLRAEFGGSQIRIKPWNKFINAHDTFMASFEDTEGRTWSVVPEKMNGEKFDGLELITPPLETPLDEERLVRAIEAIRASGKFKEGYSSSTQFTLDVSRWIGDVNAFGGENRNISSFVDVILFLESNVNMLYRVLEPRRYGHIVNQYAVPLALNQKELLNELAALPREARTFGRVQFVFKKYEAKEASLVEGRSVHAWKYRAFNYAKIFGLGELHGWRLPVIEVRIADLIQDGETLKRVGQIISRSVARGARAHIGTFKDPFPTQFRFFADKETQDSIDGVIRAEPEGRVESFLKELGLDLGRRSCGDLFLRAN